MDKRKRDLYVVLAAVAVLVVIAISLVIGTRASSVAIVNGQRISKREFVEMMEDVAGRDVLDQLITEKLLHQAAKKAGITVTDDEVNEELDKIREQFGSSFDSALAQYGMTVDDLKKTLEINVLSFKYSTKDITVTEDALKAFFDENKSDYNKPEMVRASHILVESEEEAKEILNQLNNGADFAEIAKEKSTDTMSAVEGGDLNWFGRGQMVEEFEKVAFSLQPGQTSGVVKSPFGYHIIRVTDKKAAYEAVFEDVKDEVENAVKSQQAKSVQQLASELKNESDVTITREKFKDLGTTTPFGVK